MFLTLLLSLSAQAGDAKLHLSELPNSAYTLPKGAAAIHILSDSSYGITDALQLNVNLPGLAGGPNASINYAMPIGDSFTLAAGPSVSAGWTFDTWNAGLVLQGTLATSEKNHLSLQLTPSYGQSTSTSVDVNGTTTTISGTGGRMGLKLDNTIRRSDTKAMRIWLATDPTLLASGVVGGTFGVNWTRAYGDNFRMTAGVGAIAGGIAAGIAATGVDLGSAQDKIPVWGVIPYPDIRLWWRI